MDRVDRPPVSVILPTREWNLVCEKLANQLTKADELLVVCDHESDPITGQETPDTVEVLVAGEPEGCSGKANAMAYAMERASNDRFVWTDDDFDRDDDWLDRLVAEGQQHGPATVHPIFVGSRWWKLLEPWIILFSGFSFYSGLGLWGGNAWGGGVTFTRDDLDVEKLISELQHSLSDDGLLSRHLGDVYPIRSMQAVVEVPGDFHSCRNRLVRFMRLTHVHEGLTDAFIAMLCLVVGAVLFPIPVGIAVTLLMAAVYCCLGVRRWSFLLAYPGIFLAPFTAIPGYLVFPFEWGGRQYRIHDVHEIEIVSTDNAS